MSEPIEMEGYVAMPVADGVTTITLKAGEWTADPTSTKHAFFGPGTFTIERYGRRGAITLLLDQTTATRRYL